MARKSGKTLERTLRAEYGKNNPLPKKLQFLAGVKFTAVASVILPDDERATDLVEFKPAALKKLLGQLADASAEQSSEQERALRASKRALGKAEKELLRSQADFDELKGETILQEQSILDLKDQLRDLRARCQDLASDLEREQSAHQVVKRNYEQVLANLEDDSIPLKSDIPGARGFEEITNRRRLPGSFK